MDRYLHLRSSLGLYKAIVTKELTIKIVQFVGIEAVMALVAAPLKLELVADPKRLEERKGACPSIQFSLRPLTKSACPDHALLGITAGLAGCHGIDPSSVSEHGHTVLFDINGVRMFLVVINNEITEKTEWRYPLQCVYRKQVKEALLIQRRVREPES